MKVLKGFGIVVLSLVLLVGILVGVCAIIYPETDVYVEPENYPYINWMNDYIDQDTLLTDLVIAGSHDSASANSDGSMFQPARYLIVCQNTTVKQQLQMGVRYLDLRTMLKKGTLYSQHGDYICNKFESVVADINDYLQNQKDFLILNFQHLYDEESAKATLTCLETNIRNFRSLCLTADELDFSTLTLSKIKSLGKRLLVLWGGENSDGALIGYNKKKGIGEDVLFAPYIDEIHQSTDDKLISQFDVYFEQSDGYKGLFNLQCQRTWHKKELLMGPEQLEKRFSDKANEYLLSLSAENLSRVNIIHRDFVTPEKVKLILSLNEKKGNAVKTF